MNSNTQLDFELTGDEKIELSRKYGGYELGEKGFAFADAVAKAAQRKLVLWLEEKSARLHSFGENVDNMTEEAEWQELRRAVGL